MVVYKTTCWAAALARTGRVDEEAQASSTRLFLGLLGHPWPERTCRPPAGRGPLQAFARKKDRLQPVAQTRSPQPASQP